MIENNDKENTYNFDIEDEINSEEIDLEEVDSYLEYLESEALLHKSQSQTNFENLTDEFDETIQNISTVIQDFP